MKKTAIFIVAGLFITSMAAQTVKNPVNGFEKRSLFKKTIGPLQQNMNAYHALNYMPPVRDKNPGNFKNTSEIKQKLDSVVHYSYSGMYQAWSLSEKDEYVYRNDGKLETYILSYGVDKYSNSELFYDGNGNLIRIIDSFWYNGSNHWTPAYKTEYNYDEKQKMTAVIYSSLTKQTNDWEYSYKTDFSTDVNGRLVLETSYYWDPDANEWFSSDKVEYTYDDNGNMILDTYYGWSGTDWEPIDKDEHTYNSNYQTMVTGYHWDNQWLNHLQNEYAYDDDGNLVSAIETHWEGHWKNFDKSTYSFENNGDLIEFSDYSWDSTGQTWYHNYQAEFSHNDTWPRELLVLPVYYDDYYLYKRSFYVDQTEFWFNHMLTTIISEKSMTSNIWEPSDSILYYYSEIDLSGITENTEVDVNLFPNPASSVFSLQYATSSPQPGIIEIFDLNGKKLLEKQTPKGTKEFNVDVRKLHSGFYFCRLLTKNGSVTKKLVIKK